MDNIYLKIPSEMDEEKYYDYIKEFKQYSNDSRVFCIPAQTKYKKWLKAINLAKKSGINDEQIYLYFLMDGDKLIGHISIKNKINISDNDFGNIGGAIRPSMRNKGYGKKMLSLVLNECQKLKLEEILICCNINNKPSINNIEYNGGKIQKIIYDGYDNQKYRQYKIKIKER